MRAGTRIFRRNASPASPFAQSDDAESFDQRTTTHFAAPSELQNFAGACRQHPLSISTYNDGPGRIKQITYGRSQTTEYAHLSELVSMYVAAGGQLSEELKPYVTRIGKEALVSNTQFKELLKEAAKDPVMQQTQDAFFDKAYFQPAMNWAMENGFVEALSALVIYDSFVHSGGILGFLRRSTTG